MHKPITITKTPYGTEYRCGNAIVGITPDENLDTLRDLYQIYQHPDLQALMGITPTHAPAYDAVSQVLENNVNRMPTAAETLALIADDRVSNWLFWRAVDWAVHRVAQGFTPGPQSEKSALAAAAFDALILKKLAPYRRSSALRPSSLSGLMDRIEAQEYHRAQEQVQEAV